MYNDYNSAASRIICLYGDQKIGKSWGLTKPDWQGRRMFVHDIDGGFESARQVWTEHNDPKNLTVHPGDDYRDVHNGLWAPPAGHGVYVIDTYTMGMSRFKSFVQVVGPVKGPDGQYLEALPVTDWKTIGGKISGLALDYFERWVRQVGKQNAWGIVVCQERHEDVKGQDDITKVVPDLVGQARRVVAATANFVLRVEHVKVAKGGTFMWQRVLRTEGTPVVMAADRSGALAKPHEPFDLAALIRKVEKHRADLAAGGTLEALP